MQTGARRRSGGSDQTSQVLTLAGRMWPETIASRIVISMVTGIRDIVVARAHIRTSRTGPPIDR